ncbi:MAG: hypothetical protein EPN60_03685 [Nevskiaceae bacterium]|nr:MAG: hypothetical protein EPO48_12675 [Nevskiaceae bacterium]TAM32305.1 MAG: hypothetical protein EPN60_03685 [Nevskiaceae bacterium]
MFQRLFVGFVIFTFSLQASAQAVSFQPTVAFRIGFGGAGQNHSFEAHLAFSLPTLSEITPTGEMAQHPQNIPHLSFSSSRNDGDVLKFMGSPVAVWSQPNHTNVVLQQNQQGPSSSSWFERNWWVVALGTVAVLGIAVAAGGGKDDAGIDTSQAGQCEINIIGPPSNTSGCVP